MEPMTTDASTLEEAHKVLLYAHHGWGKTTQAVYMKRRYGKGFIISGESGLRSLGAESIDYLPFQSWSGETNPIEGKYSFMDVFQWVRSDDFKKRGYQWIMVDSITEMSDRLMEALEVKHASSKNKFELWGEYASDMLAVLKIIRDMPMHVVITALAKDREDDNGQQHFWPAVQGNGVQKQIPGLFDHVLCGVRKEDDSGKVRRFLVADEMKGWHGKVRDPYRRVPSWLEGDDITKVLDMIASPPAAAAA